MHKGIIMLVKNTNEYEALDELKEFLEEYGDGKVWDWYQIGGRWTQILAPKYDAFEKKAKKILPAQDRGIFQRDIDNKQKELQELWNTFEMCGENPYTDHYKLEDDGGFYDKMPLKKCIKKVKEWEYDFIEKGKKELEEAERWLNGESGTNDYNMYGYCLKIAGEIFKQEFCFGCSVYNISSEYQKEYSVPENIEEYTAIILDIHN